MQSTLLQAPSEDEWHGLETGLYEMAREVRRRSPRARLIFVDYVTVLPEGELCPQTPLSPQAASTARATAARLAKVTADVALQTKADLVAASDLSRAHHACAADPWVTGFIAPNGADPFIPYHPNLEGMTAVAEALESLLG